jgi:Ca2+-binding EF-hand superfamily protein
MVLGLGGYAQAQTGPTPGPDKGERSRASLLQRLDADKDGKVTKSEFDAVHAAQFKAADKNGDGFVDKAEFTAFDTERRAAFGARNPDARSEARVGRIFAALDADNDGKISAAEWKASGERRFGRFDRDGNGVIEAGELARPHGDKRPR